MDIRPDGNTRKGYNPLISCADIVASVGLL
jgi:hypothetical protein